MDENEAEEGLSPADEAAEEDVDGGEAPEGESVKDGSGHGFLPGLLIGSLAGAALAALLAPLKGEEMRARAKEKVPELWGRRQELAGESLQRAQAVMGQFEGLPGGTVIARVIAMFRSLRERLRDAVEDGKEGAAESEAEARLRFEIMTRRRRRKGRA
jgi:gas vesicle protein